MSALDFAILLLYSFLRWWHSCIHWCAVTLVQAIKHLQNTLIHPSLVLNAEKMKLLMFSFAGKWPINIQEAAERASGWNSLTAFRLMSNVGCWTMVPSYVCTSLPGVLICLTRRIALPWGLLQIARLWLTVAPRSPAFPGPPAGSRTGGPLFRREIIGSADAQLLCTYKARRSVVQ